MQKYKIKTQKYCSLVDADCRPFYGVDEQQERCGSNTVEITNTKNMKMLNCKSTKNDI